MDEKSAMCVMDVTGDTKILWDRNNADEVEAARKTFKDLLKKGFKAFAVKKKGEAGDQITEFDPAMEKIILIPQIVGG